MDFIYIDILKIHRYIHKIIESNLGKNNNFTNIDNIIFNDNITRYPIDIVPNIVHYVLFTIHEIEFVHFISILSVIKNQRPKQLYIHCDCHHLTGSYYERVVSIANKTKTDFIIRKIEKPTQIFGKKLNKGWMNFHASDITRIKVLSEFGGIYLDRDSYVVKSLNIFFRYEMTIDFEKSNRVLGNQVLIAHKNARFLKLWLNSYHEYNSRKWYYNGGQLPVQSILNKKPGLIHRAHGQFGVDGKVVCPQLYLGYYPNWRQKYYAIHLFMRNNMITYWGYIKKSKTAVRIFDEQNIKYLTNTFTEMARDVFEFENKTLN